MHNFRMQHGGGGVGGADRGGLDVHATKLLGEDYQTQKFCHNQS